jgi:VWFA-related protein
MPAMFSGRGALTAATLVALGVTTAQQQQQPPPTFRTRTTVRAIEVRVVDSRGRPITGLRQEDFTILEDGKPQPIRLFAPFDLNDAAAATPAPAIVAAGTRPPELTRANRRVFLIVLGRGRLQVPSKGVDGMIHLVRSLLPQDVVSVMAWNRATPFSTDHSATARMLERYRDGHHRVEALLAQHFAGLAAIYGNRDLPPWTVKEIDAVLKGPDLPETRTVIPDGARPDPSADRVRRDIDLLHGTQVLDVIGAEQAEQIGMSLDEYVANRVQSMQDLTRIYAGLNYLRHVDGDKHLVYVSPSGLGLPSADDDRSVARVAQDARVAINIFHSGGAGGGWESMWAVASSQNIAEFTGGQYTGVTYADKFADKIDATTRVGYQLGYDPTNQALDGKYRKVTVKVNRRGATVLYHHGYYAREDFTPLDRRQVIGQSRVEAALRYPQPVTDLELTVAATPGRSATGEREMLVQVNVAPTNVAVTGTGAARSASFDVAVFCFDRQYLVGYVWRRVDMKLPDDRYEVFRRSGVGFTVHVPIRRSANMVKAVVYDYAGDRVGSATPKIQ